MTHTQTFRSIDVHSDDFTDPSDFYYRSIYLTSTDNGNYITADGALLSAKAFADLRSRHPGDIRVDGKLDCSMSDEY